MCKYPLFLLLTVWLVSWPSPTGAQSPSHAPLWNFTTFSVSGITSDPLIHGDRVYFAGDDGTVYCISAQNGALRWNFTTGNTIWSSPSYHNDTIFIGSMDTYFYALDARTGILRWKYQMQGLTGSQTVVVPAHNLVLFSAGIVYALRTSDGAMVWNFSHCCGGPAVGGDILVVGCQDNFIYALNVTNAAFLWRFGTLDENIATPAFDETLSRVFFGSTDYNFYAFQASNGFLLWQYDASYKFRSGAPGVGHGLVYAGNDGIFLAFNQSTGNVTWMHGLSAGLRTTPRVYKRYVYVGTHGGEVRAFDALGGQRVWHYNVIDAVDSSPAIDPTMERLFIGDALGELMAFSLTSGPS